MKLVIAGGRDFKGDASDMEKLANICDRYSITEIVSGTARGANRFGESFGYLLNLTVTKFPAEWDKYGKSAGYKRNEQMAIYADYVYCFPGGKGTQHMINLAIKYGKHII